MAESDGCNSKKVYEQILSSKEPNTSLLESIRCLLRLSFDNPQHFDFLLHRINWFNPPYNTYIDELVKIIRVYRSKSKECAKVAYNLLAEALKIRNHQQHAVKCLLSIFKELFAYDRKYFIECIAENYPHKLCPLEMHQCYIEGLISFSKEFKEYRGGILEIIVENLVGFDTEILAGDDWVHRIFPQDYKVKNLRDSEKIKEASLYQNYDILLSKLFSYIFELSQDPKIMEQTFLIFQKKILPIKNAKIISLVVFVIAESSKLRCNNFIGYLLGNIFDDSYNKQNYYRILTQSHFYLISYLTRSKKLSANSLIKTFNILLTQLEENVSKIEPLKIDERSNLYEIFQRNQKQLFLLQTISMIWTYRQEDLQEKFKEKFQQTLQLCRNRIYWQQFFKEDLLEKMGIKFRKKYGDNSVYNRNRFVLKYSNKFMPSILPKIGSITDSYLNQIQPVERRTIDRDLQNLNNPRKLRKEEIPFSNNSETGMKSVF